MFVAMEFEPENIDNRVRRAAASNPALSANIPQQNQYLGNLGRKYLLGAPAPIIPGRYGC
jgi:hypothetical protein